LYLPFENATCMITQRMLRTVFYSSVSLVVVLFLISNCTGKVATDEPVAEDKKETFTIVEQMPSPDGGIETFYEYLQKNIKYPAEARNRGTEEVIEVQFVVERDGSLSNITSITGDNPGLKEESETVVSKFTAFNPGSQRGRNVRVRMAIPIQFKLSDELDENGIPKGIIIINEIKVMAENLQVKADYESGTWSGHILNPDGEPIPGASIIIKGTTRGTVSDMQGSFSIDADEEAELVVSFVGYETQMLRN